MKKLTTVIVSLVVALYGWGCEKNNEKTDPAPKAEEVAEKAAEEDAPEEPAEGQVLPEGHPPIEVVTTANFSMKLWADAPEELREAVGDGVILQYVGFPGHFEVFREAEVKECILAYEKKPFDVKFMRYKYADQDSFTRAVAFEACPDVSSEKLAKQWLEVENLRAKVAQSEATSKNPAMTDTADPKYDAAGWAGRGFYKVDDADPNKTPADEEWKTFCGEKSGTPCDEAQWGS